MDLSSPALVPRLIADLRPSSDAAATVRIASPPAALAAVLTSGPAARPTSPIQGALVARTLLDNGGTPPAGPAIPSAGKPLPEAPGRVLKPWGVPMLPDRDRPEEEAQGPAQGLAPGNEAEVVADAETRPDRFDTEELLSHPRGAGDR